MIAVLPILTIEGIWNNNQHDKTQEHQNIVTNKINIKKKMEKSTRSKNKMTMSNEMT